MSTPADAPRCPRCAGTGRIWVTPEGLVLCVNPISAPCPACQRLTCVRCLKLVDVADAPGIGPYCVECGCDGFVEAGCPPEPVPVSPPAAGGQAEPRFTREDMRGAFFAGIDYSEQAGPDETPDTGFDAWFSANIPTALQQCRAKEHAK